MSLERGSHFAPEPLPPPRQESAFVPLPPTVPTELLGHPVSEAPGLALGTSPLVLAARRDPASQTTEYAALLDHPLDSPKLQQLLAAVAPSNAFALSRFAIIADWQMPDLQHSDAQRLQQRHLEGLGPHWQDFNHHRTSLLHTLLHDPDAAKPALFHLWPQQSARDHLLTAAVGSDLGYDWGFFARNPAGQEFKQALLAAIRTRQQARRSGEQPQLPEAQALGRFHRWHQDARRQLATAVYDALSPAAQQDLITALARLYGKSLVREDQEAGVVLYERDEVQVRWLGAGRVEVRIGQGLRAEAELTPDLPRHEAWRVLPETVVNRNVLLPLLRWRKDAAGQRAWNFDGLDAAFEEQLGDRSGQLPPRQEGDVLRWNPVLGPLVVAYLEPELWNGWPEQQSLPGGAFQQPMGPAQVPVLALQHREELLESALIAASERYAEQYLGRGWERKETASWPGPPSADY